MTARIRSRPPGAPTSCPDCDSDPIVVESHRDGVIVMCSCCAWIDGKARLSAEGRS